MNPWQCTNLDDGHQCPYDAYYHGRCYQHRRDAPDPERPYPLPRHSCSGCGYPEPLQHIPPVARHGTPTPLPRRTLRTPQRGSMSIAFACPCAVVTAEPPSGTYTIRVDPLCPLHRPWLLHARICAPSRSARTDPA